MCVNGARLDPSASSFAAPVSNMVNDVLNPTWIQNVVRHEHPIWHLVSIRPRTKEALMSAFQEAITLNLSHDYALWAL